MEAIIIIKKMQLACDVGDDGVGDLPLNKKVFLSDILTIFQIFEGD